ncbi:MAG TPA: Cna B-type domain-containing protein, partial [Erysipelothrix sp.]|nr:Cna B-type domain-containing protein [Erysipelothrix sp.]
DNPDQKNTVHIIDEKELESSDDDTVAKRTLGLTKTGEQKVLEDGTKLNEYTIRFNTEKHAIGGLVLTDTYSPKNVEVKYLTLTFEDGTKVPTDSYTIAYDKDLEVDSNLGEDQGRFKITFVGTTERKVYVLKYSTTYPIEEQKKDVKNTVEIEYNGGEESKDKTISRPLLKVEKAARDVDTTNVPYVISWEIQANTDRLNNNVYLKDATLTDTIESDQKYVEGSMSLFEGERATNGDLIKGKELTEDINLSWVDSTFTLELPDGLTEYIVTYDTKAIVYPSNNAKEGYYNQVILENDTVDKKFYDSDAAKAYKKLFDGEENNNSDKTGYQDPETDEIVWSVVINKHSMPINKGYMEDELDEHQTYIQDKFKVEVAVGEGENETYEEIAEEFYDLVFNTEGEKESFKLTFKERTSDPTEIEGGITHKYKITYRAELKEEFLGVHKISNAFSIIGEGGEEIDDTDSGDFNAEKWYSFAGGSGITAHLDIEKSDYVDKDKKLSLVEFALYRVVGNEKILIKDDIITDIEGEAHVSTLRAGRYILKETNGRFGYEGLPDEGVKFILSYNSDKEPVVTLDDASWSSSLGDLVDVEGSKLKVFNKKDTESKPSTEITLTKTWDDGDNADGLRPESITINVLADGEVYETHVLSAVDYLENDWSFTITDLPKENEDGSDIVYTLQELSEGDYGAEYDQENYTITNAREYDKTSFEGTKVWNDDSNRDGIRPESLEITLYRYLDSIDDKEKVDTILLTDLFSDSTGNTWSYSFADLQKNHHGQEFTYFAEEEIVEGYEQSGENGHFVNTYEPLTRSISVAKEWEDLDNAYELRPESITIELLKNGENFKTAVLSESNDWKYTFEPLFVYEDGVQIEYTIHEMKVKYYDGTVVNVEGDLDSYVITNTINRGELPTTSLTVVKDWVNGPKGDVVFNLLQNGEAIDSIELTEEMGWTYTFTGLEKFDEEGQEYVYFAEEITKLENYITSEPIIEGNTVTITNTYVSPKTDVSVKKVWVGEKADSVTINLYADGKEVSHVKLTAENNWEHVFEDLDA